MFKVEATDPTLYRLQKKEEVMDERTDELEETRNQPINTSCTPPPPARKTTPCPMRLLYPDPRSTDNNNKYKPHQSPTD
jgi:hypothetical protein